jgi:DNA-binding response OmpR family regulator
MMSKKILILDDDDDILEILAMLLSDHGYDVKTKNSGTTALEDIAVFQPDLILMDVMLGEIDGRAICKNIKENQATRFLPVILISGTHDLAALLDVPGAPDDFVAKPFDMGYLLGRIAKQLAA